MQSVDTGAQPLSRPTTAQNEGETRPGSEGAPRKCAVWSAVGCCVSGSPQLNAQEHSRQKGTYHTYAVHGLAPSPSRQEGSAIEGETGDEERGCTA